jgi:uncharacterized protein (DUF2249 family)
MESTLDIRPIPPWNRHPTIFQTFDELAPGVGFVLVNDHDPKPLYHQFTRMRADLFDWEYLEQGPSIWRVRISRSA